MPVHLMIVDEELFGQGTAGGKPWGECFCATEAQVQAADILLGKTKAK